MKILITGSEGNIGSQLVPYLRNQGHEVYGIDTKQRFAQKFITADVTTPGDLFRVFDFVRPDVVIHLAAMVSRVTCEVAPVHTVQTNIAGTANVIELCKDFKAKLLYFSTSEVYGNKDGQLYESDEPEPNNLYGLSKWLGEQLVQYHVTQGLDALVVRPFMFYHETEDQGDHRSAMIRFATGLLNGEKIVVHAGSVRSWLHMNDAVRIIEKLCHVQGFYTVNVGHPDCIRTEALAMLLCEATGRDYNEAVICADLPGRMTLVKRPDLRLQTELTGIVPEVDVETGLRLVVYHLRETSSNRK
jgi:nucleoside-diphosphate-sugar epimerase